MTNKEWIDMLRSVPEENQNTIVVVLQNGCEINVDTFFRFEGNYVIMRGRVGGTTDEGRAFFVPYSQMLYFRIERVTNLAELREMLGGTIGALPATIEPVLPIVPVAAIPANAPVTEATASRNALLDRIRAARATQAAPPSRNMNQ